MGLGELLLVIKFVAWNHLGVDCQVGLRWLLVIVSGRGSPRLLFAEFNASLALDAEFDGEGVRLFLAVGRVGEMWLDNKPVMAIVEHALSL